MLCLVFDGTVFCMDRHLVVESSLIPMPYQPPSFDRYSANINKKRRLKCGFLLYLIYNTDVTYCTSTLHMHAGCWDFFMSHLKLDANI